MGVFRLTYHQMNRCLFSSLSSFSINCFAKTIDHKVWLLLTKMSNQTCIPSYKKIGSLLPVYQCYNTVYPWKITKKKKFACQPYTLMEWNKARLHDEWSEKIPVQKATTTQPLAKSCIVCGACGDVTGQCFVFV